MSVDFFKDLVTDQRPKIYLKSFYLNNWKYSNTKVEAIYRRINFDRGVEFGFRIEGLRYFKHAMLSCNCGPSAYD